MRKLRQREINSVFMVTGLNGWKLAVCTDPKESFHRSLFTTSYCLQTATLVQAIIIFCLNCITVHVSTSKLFISLQLEWSFKTQSWLYHCSSYHLSGFLLLLVRMRQNLQCLQCPPRSCLPHPTSILLASFPAIQLQWSFFRTLTLFRQSLLVTLFPQPRTLCLLLLVNSLSTLTQHKDTKHLA